MSPGDLEPDPGPDSPAMLAAWLIAAIGLIGVLMVLSWTAPR